MVSVHGTMASTGDRIAGDVSCRWSSKTRHGAYIACPMMKGGGTGSPRRAYPSCRRKSRRSDLARSSSLRMQGFTATCRAIPDEGSAQRIGPPVWPRSCHGSRGSSVGIMSPPKLRPTGSRVPDPVKVGLTRRARSAPPICRRHSHGGRLIIRRHDKVFSASRRRERAGGDLARRTSPGSDYRNRSRKCRSLEPRRPRRGRCRRIGSTDQKREYG